MRDRLRVLVLNWRDSGHPEGGGAESFCERVASGLAALGHDVTVRCALYPGAAPDETIDGVAYERRGGRFTVYPRAALTLARRRRAFDVVIDVQNGMPFWAPLFTRARVVNVTHHLHREQWSAVFGPRMGRVGWWLESRVAPRVYRRCRYLTVSEATRADLLAVGVSASRVGVVYSGLDAPVLPVDSAAWPRSPAPSVVVLGRLVPHKRVELAMDAIAAIPGATLTVIGHGYWEPQLRAYADRIGVADAVTFAGFVDDVTKHRLLASAWVHALPSVKEGWSLAVVESAAHGTPTVAFRSAGGPTESVVDGETGILAEDEPDFTAALRQLLTDAPVREGMARAARIHAARFSWPATAAVVETELRALMGLPARTEDLPHIDTTVEATG
ncbi:MAG TPA: glycosyltransferase family 4 protein [Mycobacteriales bacterium]|jgi:glycosyltransferase involved in cell wall biosynthesis|nr:glycosyltransferase family 4 protein [Mycobacteriales bacterium]